MFKIKEVILQKPMSAHAAGNVDGWIFKSKDHIL